MGKIGTFLVALALLGTARCYAADPEQALAGLPIVGPIVAPGAATPSYVEAIGTPAAASLPEAPMDAWFQPAADADPLDVATWSAIDAFLGHTTTHANWAEACKQASQAVGAERTANPRLAALACSSDGSVTALQRFAANVLSARARMALFIKGAPGSSIGAIQSRQAEIRLACEVGFVSRQAGAGSPYTEVCAKALDPAYLVGDSPATFAALGEAYDLLAAEIARLDPTVDPEPGFFEAEK